MFAPTTGRSAAHVKWWFCLTADDVPGKIVVDAETLAEQQIGLEKIAQQLRRERLDRETEEARIFGFCTNAEIWNSRCDARHIEGVHLLFRIQCKHAHGDSLSGGTGGAAFAFCSDLFYVARRPISRRRHCFGALPLRL